MNLVESSEWLTRMKRHFDLCELVTPERFKARGEKSWNDLSPDLLKATVLLREDYGHPISINDWKRGRTKCGLRDDNKIGAKYSGHLLGLCFDYHCSNLPLLRSLIVDNYERYGFTEIETESLTPTWVHGSVRPTYSKELAVVL